MIDKNMCKCSAKMKQDSDSIIDEVGCYLGGPCARGPGPVRTGSDPVGTGSSQPSLKPHEEGRDGLGRSSTGRVYPRSKYIPPENEVYAMDLKEIHFPKN